MSFVAEHSAQSIDFTLGSSTEIWALPTSSSSSRTPSPLRRRASQGSSKSISANYVSSSSSSTSALRGATHKRASTVSGVILNGPVTHPLQDLPTSPSSSSSINFNTRQLVGRRKRRLRPDVRNTDFFTHDEDIDLSANLDKDLIDLHSPHSDEPSDNSRERVKAGKEPETPFLVHKVQPSDSLPGVSLKYGVPLADLRRANQLWTSDSIHLRQVLFIPIHLSNRKHDYRRGIDGVNGETPEFITQPPSRADSDSFDTTSPSVLSSAATMDLSASYTFPSSARLRSADNRNASTLQQSSEEQKYSSKYTKEVPIPSSATLTPSSWFSSSFLQKFPSQLTSRGPAHLYSRISAESSEASSSNISETSSDQEHEMDVFEEWSSSNVLTGLINSKISVERRERRQRTNASATVRRPTKDIRRWDSDIDLDDQGVSSVLFGNRTALSSTIPLHTEQMKPSPQMKFPVIGDK